ncbi:MAG: hypothetical protein MUF86_08730 [Akkermansiaceae bacterium]|jgi:hypothetical protein|nr:hypothetical protein [Akkermansiaceae bacterium]
MVEAFSAFAAVVEVEAGMFPGEEVAAFAEDAAEDFGDGEDVLAVRDFVADGGGDQGVDLTLGKGERDELLLKAGCGENGKSMRWKRARCSR